MRSKGVVLVVDSSLETSSCYCKCISETERYGYIIGLFVRVGAPRFLPSVIALSVVRDG